MISPSSNFSKEAKGVQIKPIYLFGKKASLQTPSAKKKGLSLSKSKRKLQVTNDGANSKQFIKLSVSKKDHEKENRDANTVQNTGLKLQKHVVAHRNIKLIVGAKKIPVTAREVNGCSSPLRSQISQGRQTEPAQLCQTQK